MVILPESAMNQEDDKKKPKKKEKKDGKEPTTKGEKDKTKDKDCSVM